MTTTPTHAIPATRPWGHNTRPTNLATCPRCGITRQVDPKRNTTMCRDCRSVEPGWGQTK